MTSKAADPNRRRDSRGLHQKPIRPAPRDGNVRVRMSCWKWLSIFAPFLIMAGPALAQQQFIYPARGQSPAQQQQDTYQCSAWATQQTGFNPTVPAPLPQPSEPPPPGMFGRPLLGGAAVRGIGR